MEKCRVSLQRDQQTKSGNLNALQLCLYHYCHVTEWAHSNKGLNHVPTRGSLVQGVCNSLGLKTENREEEKYPSHAEQWVQVNTYYRLSWPVERRATTQGPKELVNYKTS